MTTKKTWSIAHSNKCNYVYTHFTKTSSCRAPLCAAFQIAKQTCHESGTLIASYLLEKSVQIQVSFVILQTNLWFPWHWSHHANGIAEQAIQTIAIRAIAMLLHSILDCHEGADLDLCLCCQFWTWLQVRFVHKSSLSIGLMLWEMALTKITLLLHWLRVVVCWRAYWQRKSFCFLNISPGPFQVFERVEVKKCWCWRFETVPVPSKGYCIGFILDYMFQKWFNRDCVNYVLVRGDLKNSYSFSFVIMFWKRDSHRFNYSTATCWWIYELRLDLTSCRSW